MTGGRTSSAAIALILVSAGQGTAGDVAYGAHLAAECTTCHLATQDEEVGAVPALIGMEEADFAGALAAYRDGTRSHAIMQTIAARLGDEEIAALAAYYATLD